MEAKVHKLTKKLEIAEQEIENLLSENSTLTRKLSQCELKINQLTHICKSTKKKDSSKTKRNSINRTKLNFSLTDSDQNPTPVKSNGSTMIEKIQCTTAPSVNAGTTESNTRRLFFVHFK